MANVMIFVVDSMYPRGLIWSHTAHLSVHMIDLSANMVTLRSQVDLERHCLLTTCICQESSVAGSMFNVGTYM